MTAAMEILLLGTGSPMPSADRCGAGQLVTSGNDRVLIDCGWGAARRLMSAGVPLPQVNHAFFTHMHSDHITDLPDFIIMRWTAGATAPLTIYGPKGTREMVEGFRAGLAPDVRYRFAHHGEKLSRDGIECVVHEVPATSEVTWAAKVGGIEVGAFEVDHRPVEPAFGFKIRAGERAAVFSGDTKRCDSLIGASRGADVLVSEALQLGMMGDRIKFLRGAGNERMAVILEEACDYHTPTRDVAEMAQEAGVRKLVLSHLIPPIPANDAAETAFIAGMKDVFSGEIAVGRDLQRITIDA